MKNSRELIRGEVIYIFIMYHIPYSLPHLYLFLFLPHTYTLILFTTDIPTLLTILIFRFDHMIAENQQFKVFNRGDCGATQNVELPIR